MHANARDLTGERFGKLTVVRRAADGVYPSGKKYVQWACRCDCGKETMVRRGNLTNASTNSCGCYFTESLVSRSTIHGCSTRRGTTPEYRVWKAMRQRCESPKDKSFVHYGGRGITVCPRWQKFKNFLTDMGSRPRKGLSLHRVNNDLGYSPKNCKWATQSEQMRATRVNRILEIGGVKKTLIEWSEISGIKYLTIWYRLGRGVPAADAVFHLGKTR